MKWLERNTQLQHESMAEFYRLCKSLKEIKQQIGNSMFESLEAGKQSIMSVSSFLENAGYSEVINTTNILMNFYNSTQLDTLATQVLFA